MPRKARELSALEVRRLTTSGRWSVGGVDGLALQVTGRGARSWVLRVRAAGQQREMGLGSFPSVTLGEARDRARALRAQLASGGDPVAQRQAVRSAAEADRAAQQTFETLAAQYIHQHAQGWKNAKHAAQWAATLKTYAEPVLGRLLVRDITTAHVIKLLDPIWLTKTETATRVRSRLELVLDFGAARGLREGPNPARWRGNLDAALPRPNKVAKVQHHAAVPVAEVATVMVRLRQQRGMGARALEFAVLTAARSGEVRGATWAEFDLGKALWTVPAERMKAAREHRVPLSAPAMALLAALPKGKAGAPVFAAPRGGMLSDMTLSAVMRRMGLGAVPHGFRSTFRDWAAEHTNDPAEVAEMALAHAVGDKVEAAYRRGDLFEKRRRMMDNWANFLGSAPVQPAGGAGVGPDAGAG